MCNKCHSTVGLVMTMTMSISATKQLVVMSIMYACYTCTFMYTCVHVALANHSFLLSAPELTYLILTHTFPLYRKREIPNQIYLLGDVNNCIVARVESVHAPHSQQLSYRLPFLLSHISLHRQDMIVYWAIE